MGEVCGYSRNVLKIDSNIKGYPELVFDGDFIDEFRVIGELIAVLGGCINILGGRIKSACQYS